ncbi:MAG: Ig-like domain-containing protein [Anaerolineae bacterium]
MNCRHIRIRTIRASVIAPVVAALILSSACAPTTPEPQPVTTALPLPTATALAAPLILGYQPVPEDVVSPVVVQRTPAPGERLAVRGAIKVVFDRAMDRASVERAWRMQPAVAGAFAWADARTLTFQPASELPRGAVFDVALTQDARAQDGAPLRQPFVFRFETQGNLEVGQTIPADGAVDVQPDTIVTVIFNRPVVPLTTLQQQAGFPQPLRLDPPVEGRQEWLNTSVLMFRPSQPLPGGTRFTATIAGDLTDTDGNPLAAEYTWTFSTSAPKVLFVTPDPQSSRRAPVDTAVSVQFNQNIDPDSAQQAFSLSDPRGQRMAGALTVLSDTLVFTPAERLAFDTTYTVQIAPGVRSASGGPASTESWNSTFGTAPLPRVVKTAPADGETAPAFTPFIIYFNAPIDPATVMAHVRFTPALSPSQVYTYYNDWDYSFVIFFGSQPATDYVVEVEPGIADPYGNLTRESLRVAFRTDNVEPMLYVALPGDVATLNAYQPARLLATSINVSRIDLTLQKLNTSDGRFLLGGDWEGDIVQSSSQRAWRQSVTAQPNRFAYTAIDLAEDGGALAPGAYLVEISSPDVPNNSYPRRAVLVVSELNLVMKSEPAGALVWATDMKTGQPVADLPLRVYRTRYGQGWEVVEVGKGVTGPDGAAMIKTDPPADAYYGNLFVVADQRFAAASSAWSSGVSRYDFDVVRGQSVSYSGAGARPVRAHIYTDRAIYRPGQQVYARGIVRYEDDVIYTVPPAGASLRVRVSDATGQLVYDQLRRLDEYGAFDLTLDLAEGAPLGVYTIMAEVDGAGTGYANFTVASYRPPEYEVTVQPAAGEIVRNTTLTATISARYLSSGALRNRPVQWNATASGFTFDPPQLDQYTFSDYDNPWICYDCWYWRENRPSPVPLFSGAGETDARGELVISLPITVELRDVIGQFISGPVSLSIEANVTGADNQVIAGRSSVVVHPASFYLGVALSQYVVRATEPITADFVAVNWQGEVLPNTPFEVMLYQREWKNTYDEAAGQWRSETIDTLITRTQALANARGEAQVILTAPEAGAYRIVARGVDEAGRVAQSSRFVWVMGGEYVSWMRENNDRINLVADRSTYAPGDTARILIPSPFEGDHFALVTVERGHILKHDVIRVTGSSQVYELPMPAQYAPNVYVSVVLFKGMADSSTNADFKVGYLNLRVETTQQTFSVTLTPDRRLVQPGEEVTYTMQVLDSAGRPVVGQFSLDLVDKGILNLMPRQANAIVEAFYGPRGLSVQTASGLIVSANRMTEQQIDRVLRMGLGVGGDRGAGDVVEEAMPAAMAPAPMATATVEKAAEAPGAQSTTGPVIRQNFADTGFWAPAVTTDAAGRATVRITLPDNLTTWVLRAVGVDLQTRVGEGTTDVVATKPLLIRPVTPRFLTVGDEIELGAVINNNTDAPQTAEVSLTVAGISLTTPAGQSVTIPAQGEVTVYWRALAGEAPQADLVFSVQNDQYSDASRPRLSTAPGGGLKINRYSAPEVVGTAGELAQAGSRTEVIALPPALDTTQGELTVRLDPSLAAAMQAGLDYLENYDYDSADAIVSRFLPNVLTWRALARLGIENAELKIKLDALVREALDKLYALQNSDGGWSWWQRETSSPYVASYVVFGLIRAREAGFDVRPDVIDRGLSYLQQNLAETARLRHYYEFNRQAFLLYVLGEGNRHDATRVAELYADRDKLGIYAQALLALTIGRQNAQDQRLKTIFADLNGKVIQSATGAHWEEQFVDWWAMNTDTRSTAIVLSALAQFDSGNALAPNVVRWLMASRVDGAWRTTQENVWSLIALTDWMAATGELKGDYAFAAQLNNEIVAQGRASPQTITETTRITVPMAALLRDVGNRLTIGRGEGQGRLYYTAHLKAYLPVPTLPAVDRGIQVLRRYTLASCADGPRCPEVTTASVGDVIRVELTLIAPNNLYYVQLTDMLPAGAEVIDTGLATTSQLAQGPALSRGGDRPWFWWWYWYSRSELRDDRVVLFADFLSKGSYEYSYTMRVTSAGAFNVIPAFANQQYFPEVFGRSEGRLLTVVRSR